MTRSSNAPYTVQAPGLDARLVAGLTALGWAVNSALDPGSDSGEDAVLLTARSAPDLRELLLRQDWAARAVDTAWVVLTAAADSDLALALLARGAEAVLLEADTPTDASALSRQLVHAVHRKRKERASRNAYATDLTTGLPHQAQLMEHMTQLLALREREPAPMLLLVLQLQGLVQIAAQQGAESANVLRRKVAVRLRSELRASDVVAAISSDAFGVLLGRLESSDDAGRVVAKLLRGLQQPFTVAGQPYQLQASVGMALYPEHGKDAETLVKRAGAQAASVAALGLEGYGALVQGAVGSAANDGA